MLTAVIYNGSVRGFQNRGATQRAKPMSGNQPWYTVANAILLTGAGFTQIFGGYLGSEMWAAILNQPEVQRDLKLRECLLWEDTLSYEAVYDQVLESPDYLPDQKLALTTAVRRAYQEMDEILCNQKRHEVAACRFFTARFADLDHLQTRGFVFTLNQDLFNERFYSEIGDSRSAMRLPGLQNPEWFRFSVEAAETFQIQLPGIADVSKFQRRFWDKGTGKLMYVKLHGSYGWLSQDGTDAMVIGHGKKGRIEQEPLLSWHLSLFKEVLYAGDRKLVVIGYGFGDNHINEIIAAAIKDKGLQLHVICPMEPEQFRNRLMRLHGFNIKPNPYGEEIWSGLYGYYPGKVTDFYDTHSSTLPPRGQTFFQNIGLG